MSREGLSVYVYGAGRVGLAIARLARERGVAVAGLWNPRSLRPERRALIEGFALTIGDRPPAAAADLWLIAVPDDAILAIADGLAAAGGPVPGAAAHCAGAHPASLLAPLVRRGIACGSWHPAMTFRGAASDAEALSGAVVALEGDPAAVEVLASFTGALGLPHVALVADRKAHYHAALVLASNGRVALEAAAARLLEVSGLDEETARSLLQPLVERTEQNLRASLPATALTGPAARGDVRTVEAHLEALRDHPQLDDLYRALGRIALDLVPPDFRGEGHRAVADCLAGDRRHSRRTTSGDREC